MRSARRPTLIVLAATTILSAPGVASCDLDGAVAALRRGEASQAEACLVAYLESHPDSMLGHRLLGISRILLGKYEYARRSLETAVELGDRGFRVARALAEVDLRQERVFAAIERLSEVEGDELDRKQKTTWGHLLLFAVSIEYDAGRYWTAHRAALRVVSIPGLPAQVRLDAQVFAAGTALELASSLEPLQEAWLERGRELARVRFHRDRIYHREQVALLHVISARANQRLGITERACRDYQSALELAPTSHGALRVARCRSELGDWHAVRDVAETGLARMSPSVVLNSCLAGPRIRFWELRRHYVRALERLGETEQAVAAPPIPGREHPLEQRSTSASTPIPLPLAHPSASVGTSVGAAGPPSCRPRHSPVYRQTRETICRSA